MKYKLTDETMIHNGITLHRIECIEAFNAVEIGDKGGWIESMDNLSQDEDASIYDAGFYGYYWSSTITEFMDSAAYYLYFDLNSKDIDFCQSDGEHTVRLVSDTPFEDFVEFNGVYWKTENEDGYYNFDEAINKFG